MRGLNLKALLILTAVLGGFGCAKEKKQASGTPSVIVPPPGTPWVPPTVGPGQNPGGVYGGSASISIVGGSISEQMQRMGEYTGRAMNDVQNLKLNLNMLKAEGAGTFGGTATITYNECYGPNNCYYREGFFTAGRSAQETQYNVWFASAGKTVWHAVFEDFMGGLVVVIDEVVDLGDGSGPQDKVSGSVWFKNFQPLTYAPHPPTYCWFVSLGPYDCRPWPAGNGMNSYQSVEPQAGYKMLGRFKDLSIKAAFNNQKVF